MALKFPLEFSNGNLPFVIFSPYKYDFPKPNLTKYNPPNKSGGGQSVVLYLPGDFSESVNASWGLESTFGGSTNSIAQGILGSITEQLGRKDAKILSQSKQTLGKVPFPTDTLIFNGVEPVSLNFSFNMIPFNQAEGNAIVSIIKHFKTRLLPQASKDANNLVLDFPDIWDIKFENINGMGLEQDKLYENMALMGCNVQYVSGTENMTVYHDNNPTQVRLNLTFQSIRKQFIL